MYRKIPASRPCAAPCRRIDLVASSRLAAAWFIWLAGACAVVLFAVALPLLARIAICFALATANVPSIGACVLLRGRKSVRAIAWEQAEFTVQLGAMREPVPALVAPGSFRLGWLIVLRLKTSGGMRAVLIDGGRQELSAFRLLCRRLTAVKTAVPGVPGSATDTIRPKV
jgi:hypothetical protein